MNIANTPSPGPGEADLLLAALADRLVARRIRDARIVQFSSEHEKTGPCDMEVKLFPDGPVLRILKDLGPGALGCRRDTAALEAAVGHVEAQMPAGVGVLIVNKLDKHEAEGRGFRNTIGAALAEDIPVLVGVNRLNFDALICGLAKRLSPEAKALVDWVFAHLKGLARHSTCPGETGPSADEEDKHAHPTRRYPDN